MLYNNETSKGTWILSDNAHVKIHSLPFCVFNWGTSSLQLHDGALNLPHSRWRRSRLTAPKASKQTFEFRLVWSYMLFPKVKNEFLRSNDEKCSTTSLNMPLNFGPGLDVCADVCRTSDILVWRSTSFYAHINEFDMDLLTYYEC